ncbi:LysR family transcriptional regulator, partial [Sinorhizobium meliloti]
WRFQGREGWEHVRMNSRFCTDNGQMLLAAARAGLGVVLAPMFMVEGPLERGEFEAVLSDFPHEGGDLQIFMPPARAGIARVRALVDFLYEKFDREI